MSLVQDDDMVQDHADTPDQAFDIGVLPGTPGGDHDSLIPIFAPVAETSV